MRLKLLRLTVNVTKQYLISTAAHRIQTEGTFIVHRCPYRVSLAERKIIEENVVDML